MESGITTGKKSTTNLVTNDSYNIAWNNTDNTKMMHEACKKYRGILERDDINSCQMIGLWKALGEFNEKHGVKFTSYLYNVVRNECRKRLRQNNNNTKLVGFIAKRDYHINSHDLEDMIDVLEYPLNKIVRLRYISKMTLKEIGVELGMNKNSVKRKIQKALEKIKTEWT